MARVTVEDCILNIPNRFELVTLAAQRAKQISAGNPITIDRDNDKDAVVSLREIADQTVDFGALREELIEKFSRYQRPDIIEGEAPMSLTAENRHQTASHTAQIRESYEEDAEVLADEDAMEGDDSSMSFGDEEIDSDD